MKKEEGKVTSICESEKKRKSTKKEKHKQRETSRWKKQTRLLPVERKDKLKGNGYFASMKQGIFNAKEAKIKPKIT